MKLKTIIMMLALCMMVACGEDPECPTCPEPPILECPEGYILDTTTDPWSCVEIDLGPSCGDLKGDFCSQQGTCPEGYESLGVTYDCNPCCTEPAPVMDADPKDYITLGKGARLINDVEADSRTDLYHGIWTNYRNPRDAALRCGSLIQPTFGISASQLLDLANDGLDNLTKWNDRPKPPWREKLQRENRRAAEHPEFEGYTGVRKEYWQPFEDKLRAQKTEIDRLTAIAQGLPLRQICAYDNLAGWCGCKLANP
jgi:hypothetical protein